MTSSEPVPQLRGISGIVLTVRFLTELALLAGLAVAGARLGESVVFRVVDAVLLPAVAVAVWSLFIAPRARRRLPEPARFLVELALFGTAGLALALTDWLVAGVVLAVVGIGVAALTRVYAKDG